MSPLCGGFLLCRRCDRRCRYCSPSCARDARRAVLRAAGIRYQGTRDGRFAHAARQLRYRTKEQPDEIVTHRDSARRAATASVDVVDEAPGITPEPARPRLEVLIDVAPMDRDHAGQVRDPAPAVVAAAGPVLRARLPLWPAQPQALRLLLEGLGAWLGQPLRAVLDADAEDVRRHPERRAALLGDLDAAHIAVEWVALPRPPMRDRFLEAVPDFDQARRLLHRAATGIP